MRAAIYARRSTEEHQAASLNVQTEEARKWIEAHGWSLDEAHVYIDSGVSRAEMVRRPGLLRMLNAAASDSFDAIVTRDETRLGGDTFRVGVIIQDLTDAGVELHYYFTSEKVEIRDPMQKAMLAMKSAFAELERGKIASRTREGLEHKARKGYNVGGRVFGYDNVDVMDGERRSRVEYAINEVEAAVVRDVFARYAAGEGVRAIAAVLNALGVPSPRVRVRGSGSWSPSCVGEIVRRERYRGVLIWGRLGAAYKGGTRVITERPAVDCVRVERPDLAIIDAATWAAVAGKMEQRVRLTTSTRSGPPARNLLSGLARCAQCGGPMGAANATKGVKAYRCKWSKDRGPTVCTNSTCRPVTEVDSAVVSWIQANVLTPTVIDAILSAARQRSEIAAPRFDGEADALETDLRRVHAEIARVTTAIATTDTASDSLARALVEREARARSIAERLAIVRTAARPASTAWAEIEAEARKRMNELLRMFQDNVTSARAALSTLLRGPVQCTTVRNEQGKPRFRLTGEVALGAMLDAYPLCPTEGDPNGISPEGHAVTIPFAIVTRAREAA